MMPQAITEKSAYGAAFEVFRQGAGRGAPAWLEQLREDAIERFERAGFPTTDEEDWKYTNVSPLARQSFTPAPRGEEVTGPTGEAIESFAYPEARRTRLVFINGVFSPGDSSIEGLPEGVTAGDLGEALEGPHAALIREHLSRGAGNDADAFTSLNTAFLGSGAFLHVPDGISIDAPVHLLFIAGGGQPVAAFPRVLVHLGRGSSATVIESYGPVVDEVYFTNAVVQVSVGEGARLTHYKVQREGERAYHIASTLAELGRASFYDLTTVTLGAQLSRHNVRVLFGGEGGECWVDGLYIVGTGQHTNTHSLIDHGRPHCTSHQNYKGILDGKSRAVFNGRVFVHREAQKTDAYQSNKNLVLSDEARVDTKPQLEIFNDDVKCAHGATVGQIEEEELFYLASRGLTPELARNLLTYGFAEEIVAKITVESIRAQLDESILNRLHARLEV